MHVYIYIYIYNMYSVYVCVFIYIYICMQALIPPCLSVFSRPSYGETRRVVTTIIVVKHNNSNTNVNDLTN